MNLKDKIKHVRLNLRKVHVKEWNEDIFIKRLTLNETIIWDESRVGIKDDNDPRWIKSRAVFLSLCLVDETGKRLFDKPEELGDVDHIILAELGLEALEHNGMTKKAREEIEKKA